MPLAVLSAMRECSTYKITVKGGKFLEAVAEADTIVFDKTGTLTLAKPKVADVICFDGCSRETVLRYAACLEEHFPHSVANAIVRQAADEGITHDELHSKVEYIVAHGIASRVGDKRIVIGSHHFIFEDEHCRVPESGRPVRKPFPSLFPCLYGIERGPYGHHLHFRSLAPGSCGGHEGAAPRWLPEPCHDDGRQQTDSRNVAATLELDRFYAEVLPEEKAQFVKAAKPRTPCRHGRRGIMTPLPCLKQTLGLPLPKGLSIAREIADITISARDLHQLIVLRN